MRAEAVKRLQRRGEWSGSFQDWERLREKRAGTAQQTERLSAESGGTPSGAAILGRAAVDTGKALFTPEGNREAFSNLRTQAEDMATGVGDVLNWGTAGGYRKVRDAVGDFVAPDATQEARDIEARPPGFQRNMGRAIGMAPLTAATASAVTATTPVAARGAGLLSRTATAAKDIGNVAGRTAAVEYPLAMGRRVSEGEGEEAIVNAAGDAAIAGGVAGTFRGAGKALDWLSGKSDAAETYRGAKAAGDYDADPSLRVDNDAGLERLAARGMRRASGGLEQQRQQAMQRYAQGEKTALAMDEGVPTDSVLASLDRIRRSRMRPDGSVQPEWEKAVGSDDVWANLVDRDGRIKMADLLSARRAVAKKARFDRLDASDENLAYRDLYDELNGFLHSVKSPSGQALRQADASYAQEMATLRDANDVMFNSNRESVGRLADDSLANVPPSALVDDPDILARAVKLDRVTKERAGASTIRYSAEADKTIPGGVRAEQIDRLADANPQAARAIGDQQRASAYRETRFNFPISGLEDFRMRNLLGSAGRNVRAGQARIVAPLAAEFSPAAAATAGLTAPMLVPEDEPPTNPLTRAVRKRDEKDRKAARLLKRGGRRD